MEIKCKFFLWCNPPCIFNPFLQKPSNEELETLKTVENCQYFLKVKDSFENQNGGKFFITDSSKDGTLSEYLRNDGPLTEGLIRSIMNQLLEIADYLQRQQLAYISFDNDNIFVEKVIDSETEIESINIVSLSSNICRNNSDD